MSWTRSRAGSVAVVLVALACAPGCKSNSAVRGAAGAGGVAGGAGAGAGGMGGSAGADAGGDGCAPTAAAGGAVDINGCPTAYVLHHYSGDTCGLCDPGASTQCSSACDWATTPDVECTPDGKACVYFSLTCAKGPGEECGWTGAAACPALAQAARTAVGGRPCVRDDQCDPGHYCSIRVYGRMFCDNGPPVYAKDYCPDAGTDAGADASDAGNDAADAAP